MAGQSIILVAWSAFECAPGVMGTRLGVDYQRDPPIKIFICDINNINDDDDDGMVMIKIR